MRMPRVRILPGALLYREAPGTGLNRREQRTWSRCCHRGATSSTRASRSGRADGRRRREASVHAGRRRMGVAQWQSSGLQNRPRRFDSSHLCHRDVAQHGQSARFGSGRPQVRILLSRQQHCPAVEEVSHERGRAISGVAVARMLRARATVNQRETSTYGYEVKGDLRAREHRQWLRDWAADVDEIRTTAASR